MSFEELIFTSVDKYLDLFLSPWKAIICVYYLANIFLAEYIQSCENDKSRARENI